MVVGLAAIVAPWMVRTHLFVGNAEISTRASVIYGRAVMNQRSIWPEEIRQLPSSTGFLIVWAKSIVAELGVRQIIRRDMLLYLRIFHK
jgi:hypothetical protein